MININLLKIPNLRQIYLVVRRGILTGDLYITSQEIIIL